MSDRAPAGTRNDAEPNLAAPSVQAQVEAVQLPPDLKLPKLSSPDSFSMPNSVVGFQQPQQSPGALAAIGTHITSGTSVDITSDGVIAATDSRNRSLAGSIRDDGSYVLRSGERGNVFGDGSILLNQVDRNATLATAYNGAAARGSIIPQLRSQLTETGAGVTIVGIDSDPEHLRSVGATAVGHPNFSVAPGATWVNEVIPAGRIDLRTSAAGLDSFIGGRAGVLSELTDRLNTITDLKERNPERFNELRVVNMSVGQSNQSISGEILSALEDPRMGPHLGQWRTAIFGKDELPADRAEAAAGVQSYIERSLGASKDFAAIHDSYIAATARAQAAGMVLTVAAGNRSADVPLSAPGRSYNFAAMSPHVVSVGASNTNQTPADFRDDFVRTSAEEATFRGQKFSPTISAPGEYVQVAEPIAERPGQRGVFVRHGSSISAPIAAGTFALMFEANPRLTPAGAIAIARQTAVDTKLAPAIEGAGMLDPVSAVKKAKAE